MRICKKCGVKKVFKWKKWHCIPCKNARHRAYDAKQSTKLLRKQWIQRNYLKRIFATRQYNLNHKKKHQGKHREYVKSWHKKHPWVARASWVIRQEVKAGRIPPAWHLPCVDRAKNPETCMVQAKEYDHHMGYEDKYLKTVEPVCRSCHCRRSLRKKK